MLESDLKLSTNAFVTTNPNKTSSPPSTHDLLQRCSTSHPFLWCIGNTTNVVRILLSSVHTLAICHLLLPSILPCPLNYSSTKWCRNPFWMPTPSQQVTHILLSLGEHNTTIRRNYTFKSGATWKTAHVHFADNLSNILLVPILTSNMDHEELHCVCR